MSYTGDDLLYIRLPGAPVAGDPGSPQDCAVWVRDLAARHRTHGSQLNNHRCWFRNLLPGLEAEHKFTLPPGTGIWRLATLTHEHVRSGSLPGWICEHGNNGGFEQWDFTNHLFEITHPRAERGYIAFIPAINGDGWIIRRKRYHRDQAIRREELTTAPDPGTDAHLPQFIRDRFGLTPAWGATYRRVRYNAMLESLATGHLFSIMYDRCTTAQLAAPPLVQAEVEYIRSRTLHSNAGSQRAIHEELNVLITWTRKFLHGEGIATAENHLSKLTWLRQYNHSTKPLR